MGIFFQYLPQEAGPAPRGNYPKLWGIFLLLGPCRVLILGVFHTISLVTVQASLPWHLVSAPLSHGSSC